MILGVSHSGNTVDSWRKGETATLVPFNHRVTELRLAVRSPMSNKRPPMNRGRATVGLFLWKASWKPNDLPPSAHHFVTIFLDFASISSALFHLLLLAAVHSFALDHCLPVISSVILPPPLPTPRSTDRPPSPRYCARRIPSSPLKANFHRIALCEFGPIS